VTRRNATPTPAAPAIATMIATAIANVIATANASLTTLISLISLMGAFYPGFESPDLRACRPAELLSCMLAILGDSSRPRQRPAGSFHQLIITKKEVCKKFKYKHKHKHKHNPYQSSA